MNHSTQDKIILGPNQQPFPNFHAASFMRDQLNQIAPEYGFIVSEHPNGGYIVKASRNPTSSAFNGLPQSGFNQNTGQQTAPSSFQTYAPSGANGYSAPSYLSSGAPAAPQSKITNKLSKEAEAFFSRTPITLRPAWRNFYIQMPLTIVGLIVAFLSKFILEAYVPRDMLVWIYQKMPYFNDLIFWSIVVISCYYLLIMAYHRYSNTYTITKEGVKEREGLFARDALTIKFKDIRSVALEQSVFDRILGIGTVEFYTAGYEGADVAFKNIAQPMKIRDILDEYINTMHYKAE